MTDHPYGWLSLLPPVVAILLAIITRKAILALLIGIFCGALLTSGGNPLTAIGTSLEVHLWSTLTDPGKMRVFAFTALMGAMVGVIAKCGGMRGLIHLLTPLAKGRRSGQFITWLLGLVVFFDDYANTILLGSTLRGLCDRLKISREKLAYLVDSTAATVASLALLSTWIAVELEYIQDGIADSNVGEQFSAMELFISSIPYRFYSVVALLFVPIVALTGRDFGPMARAERRLNTEGPTKIEGAEGELEPDDEIPARWYNAVLPIAVTLGVVVWLLYKTGSEGLGGDWTLRDVLGSADSSLALQYGSIAGLLTVALMCRTQNLLSTDQIIAAAISGFKVVLPALGILLCASALSSMTGSKSYDGTPPTEVVVTEGEDKGTVKIEPYEFKDHRLYTGEFLTDKVVPKDESDSSSTTLKLLPTAIFILAAFLSFATGTSFGTMGILMPMTVVVACGLLKAQSGGVDPTDPILLASIASVLSGAVFGDHCSPISDTTILSATASSCNHMAHVLTQLPYALLVGAVTILLGTLPLGWGVSIWILFPLQFAALITLLFVFGKRSDEGADGEAVV